MKINRKAVMATKLVLGALAGWGARHVAQAIIEEQMPEEDRKRDKVATKVGSWAIGGTTAFAAQRWIDDAVDRVVEVVESGVGTINDKAAEATVVTNVTKLHKTK